MDVTTKRKPILLKRHCMNGFLSHGNPYGGYPKTHLLILSPPFSAHMRISHGREQNHGNRRDEDSRRNMLVPKYKLLNRYDCHRLKVSIWGIRFCQIWSKACFWVLSLFFSHKIFWLTFYCFFWIRMPDWEPLPRDFASTECVVFLNQF